MALSSIYAVDSTYDYNVGGYDTPLYKFHYTKTFSDMELSVNFDSSILIAGNKDCDFLTKICDDYTEYVLSQNGMIEDSLHSGYKSVQYLGSCICTYGDYGVYNISKDTMLSDGLYIDSWRTNRFMLGNINGLNDIVPLSYVERITGNTARQGVENANYWELDDDDIVDNCKFTGINAFVHYDKDNNTVSTLNFTEGYKPNVCMVFNCNGDICIASASTILTGLIKIGRLPSYDNLHYGVGCKFGVLNTPEWENKSTDVSTIWVTPPDGNKVGMTNETYNWNSYGYIRSDYTYSGKLFKRILNIIGLYYAVDAITDGNSYKANIALGVRDENGIIKQDVFTRGLDDIIANNPYYNLNYDELPSVKPDEMTDEDEIDDMPVGSMSYTNGFVKYYRVTKGQLDSISDALSEQTEYTNLSQNIISLKSYIINTDHYINQVASESVEIGSLDTDTIAERIKLTTSSYYLGSYSINGKYGSAASPHFLDKSPHTKMEIYIPYCGTIDIPDTCMYKTIDVYLLSDILQGTCQGVVKCNGNIVAQKSGIIAVDMPITSTDNALKYNACLSSVLSSVNSGAAIGFSASTGNVMGAFSGIMSAVQNANNYRMAQNANYTKVVGSQGDSIEHALPDTCYIKIYRTIAHEPEGYTHKYGKPCNKYMKLSNCYGFTQCFNPTISGNMTESERNTIRNLLEQGIYL